MRDMLMAVSSLNLFLFVAAVTAAILIIRATSLLSASVLTGFFSLLMALMWVNMGAMDVAFTEASVSAGISTILLISALAVVGYGERNRPIHRFSSLAVVMLVVLASLLLYGTLDMPSLGDPTAPIHNLRVPDYIQQTVGGRSREHQALASLGQMQKAESFKGFADERSNKSLEGGDFGEHAPNFVTTLLAAYRGFDTMFESAVIFTAGISLVLLIKPTRRKRRSLSKDEKDETPQEESVDG